jgi:NADH dehydrogenase
VRIAVTGASGFIGRHVVRGLRTRGHTVRALVRDPARAPFPRADVEIVPGTLADEPALATLVTATDAVIHLVGIIVERGTNTFEAVHVGGTRALLAAALAHGCRRIVYLSAIGARDAPDATPYHRTKRRGELAVLASEIPAVIVRPSLVSGPESEPIRMLARLHKWLPAVPVFGDGSYPLQPVWIDDLALALTLAAERSDLTGVHELGGPAPLTYLEFVRAIGRAAGAPRPVVRVPLTLARAGAGALAWLGHRAPVTRDQLQMLAEGSATPDNAIETVFGITPLPFEEGLGTFLRR